MSMQRRLEAVPVLRALPPPVLARLAGAAVERALPRGGGAYVAGDPADHLFVVISGTVKLCQVTADGRETVSALVGPGEIFGEGLDQARSHDARAVEPTRVLVLPLRAVRDEPVFANLLQHRLEQLQATLHAMALGGTEERIAARILDLAGRQGRSAPGGIVLGIRLTQEDLARMAGCSRETANKVLASFRKRGWLRADGAHLLIRDVARLRVAAGVES